MIRVWPEHHPYLCRRFAEPADGGEPVAQLLAERILRITGDALERVVDDYRWTCSVMLEEEQHFRRHGRYRHTSFAEVRRQVYDDPAYMRRYTNGLLMSQLLWTNHFRAMVTFRNEFLPGLAKDASLLEVGPGHGLLLALAREHLVGGRVTGWDVSPASLAATRAALDAMATGAVTLAQHDLLAAPVATAFDAVVASELVEHLEDPVGAVRRLAALTKPGGTLFLNIPVNSPAPDHISLWRSPAEVRELVTGIGLAIVEVRDFPMTGKSMAEAVAHQLTVSCVMICRRSGTEG
ncbi:class I SAM-dependent methyltransferase [Actinoplanes derwentensis]|uniref:class I SAM-dependent methyltransferase n=1 Tax=Actinoplanes derwentensis TaxID=113562 RepID=UPI001943C28A|nr:class I SAM-dependent methyltransferase [Actinoplanes derwentensis]